MADVARKWTDKQLKSMEHKISDIYKKSTKDITKKWQDFMDKGETRLKSEYEAYINAKPEDKAQAKKAYENAVRSYTLENEKYKQMLEHTTAELARANEAALAYSQGKLPDIYAKNYNSVSELTNEVGFKFNTVNADTVKNLITNNDITLPNAKKRMSIPKDMRWNTKQLNSSVLQGLLQGESMDKIAKRILPVVDRNQNAAIRNARTMVTGAENKGRLDSYARLEEDGLVLKKVWIATADERTREWHLTMDGQEVDIDELFVDGNGNELDYPGDPSAEPETVYNCRCTMRTRIVGIRGEDGEVYDFGIEHEEGLHARQIQGEIESRRGDESTFDLVGGLNDPEITDSIWDYYLPQATRDKLVEIENMSTYNDFKTYFSEQGIELSTGLEKLRTERADDDIPAVKELLQKVAVGVDSYKESFGEEALSSLKEIVLYDQELDTHAAYFFNLVGESDPYAGMIKFSDWNVDGRDVFHELGHAFQDSMKNDGEDIISFSNRIATQIDIPNSAYKGTSGLGEENAEMMAEALGFGFSHGLEHDIDFIKKLRKLLA